MIRVLVVDDQVLTREGIRAILEGERDIEVVGDAKNGQDAVTQTLALSPDLILMDIRMPDGDGIEAARMIKHRAPNTQVLMVSAYADQDLFHSAISAGAAGYVLKDISPANLAKAIRAIHNGKTMINPDLARKMMDYVFQMSGSCGGGAPRRVVGLTQRETEVIVAVARGFSNREIAKQLFVSESTVKTHLRSVYHKLKLRNRAQAAGFAIEKGLLPTPLPTGQLPR